ncbi:hypothetical protein B9J78_05345 [bacterium Unc6]|nr:hypothetical protein [bacterium Unc6]
MKNIWAPWRIKYIKNTNKEKGCFLCNLLKKNIKFKTSYIIWKGKYTTGVLNKFPYTNGHIIIAPNRHIDTLSRLKKEEKIEIMQAMVRYETIIKKALNCQGFNIGINIGKQAGAGVPGHIHIHIVPRWEGDTNFMSTLASIRIIPQSLSSTWQAIRDAEKQLLKQSKVENTNLLDYSG